MEQILYGAPVAEQLDKISENIFREHTNKNKKPHLTAITVGDNPASLLYVSRKKEKAIELGVDFNWIKLDVETSQEILDEVIRDDTGHSTREGDHHDEIENVNGNNYSRLVVVYK